MDSEEKEIIQFILVSFKTSLNYFSQRREEYFLRDPKREPGSAPNKIITDFEISSFCFEY